MIRASRERDLVEAGMLGGPEFGPVQIKLEGGAADGIRGPMGHQLEFGDLEFHRRAEYGGIWDSHADGDQRLRGYHQ